MKRFIPTLCLALGGSLCAKAQLYIDNATFFIESGATVTVQGDVTSNTSIQGTGKILLKGSALQNVNMNNGGAATNAYTIPNLEIDNAANATLTGNVRIGSSILFTNGKLQAGAFNVVLANAATTTGMGTNKFIETNGAGFAQREIGNAAGTATLPVGTGSTFAPVSLTHSGGTYANATLNAQAKGGKSLAAHPRTESYTNVYWPLATSGVTGGTLTGTGTYTEPGTVGTETDIRGMSFDGTAWSLTGGAENYAAKTVTAQLAGNSGQLFGMNRFLLLNSRVLLQGASNGTAVMTDGLRTAPNVIPTTEPYRNAPYSFVSVNGGTQETIVGTPFAEQASTNDNIVDWVFVELRNGVASGSTVQQTRSVFVQRDGDLIDIDNLSPVYFKNLDGGDYTVTVRHRNHLPISTNNAGGFFKPLTLAPSASLDFTTLADGSVLGTSGTHYTTTGGGLKMMWGGNANFNANVRYGAAANDKDYLLGTVLSGNSGLVLSNVYSPGDLNMNKGVRYGGAANDKDFLLASPLAGNSATIRNQIIPN